MKTIVDGMDIALFRAQFDQHAMGLGPRHPSRTRCGAGEQIPRSLQYQFDYIDASRLRKAPEPVRVEAFSRAQLLALRDQ